MAYIILPVIAGVAISMQGILSSKMGTKTGFMETAVLIHLFGLLTALAVYIVFSRGSLHFIIRPSLISVIAGSMGVIIVICIAKSISLNGAAVTVIVSVLIQMVVSKIIEHYGLFGVPRTPVNIYQILSILMIAGGVILFQKSA